MTVLVRIDAVAPRQTLLSYPVRRAAAGLSKTGRNFSLPARAATKPPAGPLRSPNPPHIVERGGTKRLRRFVSNVEYRHCFDGTAFVQVAGTLDICRVETQQTSLAQPACGASVSILTLTSNRISNKNLAVA
jgi:hypothetical protein